MLPEEEKLLKELKAGKEAPYRLLFDQYYTLLTSYSLKFQPDLETAREIVQQLFIKMYETRETIKIKFSIKSYLLKSVYYESIRSAKNSSLLSELEEHDSIIDQDDLEEAEKEAAIWDIIHQLTPTQQQVLKLSRLEGMSNDQIAAHLQISKRTVETHVSNALKFLRNKIGILSIFLGL